MILLSPNPWRQHGTGGIVGQVRDRQSHHSSLQLHNVKCLKQKPLHGIKTTAWLPWQIHSSSDNHHGQRVRACRCQCSVMTITRITHAHALTVREQRVTGDGINVLMPKAALIAGGCAWNTGPGLRAGGGDVRLYPKQGLHPSTNCAWQNDAAAIKAQW